MTTDIDQGNVYDTFQKVLAFCGLWARSDSVYDPLGPSSWSFVAFASPGPTLVPHPFVCERGYVRADVEPAVEVGVMITDLVVCKTHSYEALGSAAERCRMHPVVDAGQLAAWALGGVEAVRTRQTPRTRHGYDKHVYQAWEAMTGHFRKAVLEHDARLAQADKGVLNVGAHVTIKGLDKHIVIKVRPNERRKRKR